MRAPGERASSAAEKNRAMVASRLAAHSASRLWAADSAEKDADGVADQDYSEDKEEDAHDGRVVSDHPVLGVV